MMQMLLSGFTRNTIYTVSLLMKKHKSPRPDQHSESWNEEVIILVVIAI